MMGPSSRSSRAPSRKTVNMPEDGHRRGRRAAAHRRVEARREGGRHLPRQLQGGPAALDGQEGRRQAARRGPDAAGGRAAGRGADRREGRSRRSSRSRSARSCPATARRRTFEFRVADCKGFVTVGEYDDGRPGRDLHPDLQAGLDPRRDHGRLRHLGELRPPVRRAAAGLRRDVHQHPLRAGRHDRRPRHPVRLVARRLHLPPPGGRLPDATRSGPSSASSPSASAPSRRCRVSRRRSPRPGRARRPGRPADSIASGPLLDDLSDAPTEPSLLERAGVTDPAPAKPSPAVRPRSATPTPRTACSAASR